MSLHNQQIAITPHAVQLFAFLRPYNQHVRCVRLLPLPAGCISLPEFNCSKCQKRVHQSRMMRTLILGLHMQPTLIAKHFLLHTKFQTQQPAHVVLLTCFAHDSRRAVHAVVAACVQHGISLLCMLCRSDWHTKSHSRLVKCACK